MAEPINLSPTERVILAVDVSTEQDADRLVSLAQQAGARFVKLGLELSSATSWGYCSDLAKSHGINWVADAKLDDIGNTTVKTARNIANKPHPPFGITIHTNSAEETLRNAQQEVGDILMLGVTELTDVPEEETEATYRVFVPEINEYRSMTREELVIARATKAARAGLRGVVASPKEVGVIKSVEATSGLFAMIPATRSPGVDSNEQANVGTPTAAIRDGANLLVIGREITNAEDPAAAFQNIVRQIEAA